MNLLKRLLPRILVHKYRIIRVARRLSTVMMADGILVLDDGRIAEEGTHALLHAAGGLYARLCQCQGIFWIVRPKRPFLSNARVLCPMH